MRNNQDMLRGSQIGNLLNPPKPVYTRNHHAENLRAMKEEGTRAVARRLAAEAAAAAAAAPLALGQGKYAHVESRLAATLAAARPAGGAGSPAKENARPPLKAKQAPASPPPAPFVRPALAERKAPLPNFSEMAKRPATVRAACPRRRPAFRRARAPPHAPPPRPPPPRARARAPTHAHAPARRAAEPHEKLFGRQHGVGGRAAARSGGRAAAKKGGLRQGARVPGDAQGDLEGGGGGAAEGGGDKGGVPARPPHAARGGAGGDACAGDLLAGGLEKGGAAHARAHRASVATPPPLLRPFLTPATRRASPPTPTPQLLAMPLRIELPSALRRKADLEAKVAKLEDAVKIFSRNRVFVKLE
jgi:hypothetical protein